VIDSDTHEGGLLMIHITCLLNVLHGSTVKRNKNGKSIKCKTLRLIFVKLLHFINENEVIKSKNSNVKTIALENLLTLHSSIIISYLRR